MMKLSTMQAVVDTVDDQWECDLAEQLLLHWEHDPDRAKYWRASANFIFFFKKSDELHVLRFNHVDERSATEIQSELDFVNYLANQGVNVARPILSKAENLVELVSTGLVNFHAVAFKALPGKQIGFDELTPEQVSSWGEALGKLHKASIGYKHSGRPSWKDHLKMVSEMLPNHEADAQRALNELEAQLGQLKVTDQNFGLIHFDFETDNILLDVDQIGIIDFDDCASYWFAADIAFALRDLFEDSADKVDFQNEIFLQFIEGYRKVRPIDMQELEQIPLFLKLHNFIIWAKLLRTLTPINLNGEPEWMADLRKKLAAKIEFCKHELI